MSGRIGPRRSATVMEGTNTWREVGIHLKGQYGTFQGIDGRPSLTLNFDKYQKGQRFHGLDKLHLNNSGQDPSFLCEMIGRQLFEAAGIPTARASHARVELNGRDLGLFVLVEGYDKKFLRRHFENSDGNLYDSEFRHDITDPIKKSSGKGPDDHSDLRALAAAAEEPNHSQRLARLSKLLDLDRFYTTLALETLIRHHDGYAMGINNYRVYFEPTDGRAVFLPHGMDQFPVVYEFNKFFLQSYPFVFCIPKRNILLNFIIFLVLLLFILHHHILRGSGARSPGT
jgi:spore coat protein CotH